MQSVHIITVGKLKEKYWTDACAEYAKRLTPFCKLQITEIAEHRLPSNPSAAEIEAGLAAEADAILAKLPTGCAVIPLCIEGKTLTSVQLAESIARFAGTGYSTLAFVIGSSHGLAEKVKSMAALRLSLSGMTFPHQLARVMLLEQVYRAFGINAGLKYHK